MRLVGWGAGDRGKERRRRSGNLAAEETEIGLEELCERAGITQAQARELAEYGLLERPLTPYDADTAAVCARLVAAGLSNREIATSLVLSEHTVHRHVANVLRKLAQSSRAAAAATATRAGYI